VQPALAPETAEEKPIPLADIISTDQVNFETKNTRLFEDSFDEILFGVKRSFHEELAGEHDKVLKDSIGLLNQLPSQRKYFPRRPLVMPKLMRAINSSKSGTKELVLVISQDPVLAGELLKIANSPYYRVTEEPIDGIGRAIVLLGMDGLKSMASTLVMQPVLHTKIRYFPEYSETVWLQSVKAALAAQAFARQTRSCDSFQAHLLGLLSSIGPIVLFQMANDVYTQHSGLHLKAEVFRVLRRQHADGVSSAVVKEWKLSDEFVDILDKHQCKMPVNEQEPLGRALYYGRLLATAHMIFATGSCTEKQVRELACEQGLAPSVFDKMWAVLDKDQASVLAGTMVSAQEEPRKSA